MLNDKPETASPAAPGLAATAEQTQAHVAPPFAAPAGQHQAGASVLDEKTIMAAASRTGFFSESKLGYTCNPWEMLPFARAIEAEVASRCQVPPVPAPTEQANQWISVAERLPTKYCLAVYQTRSGQQRRIRAMHVKQYEIEASGDECDSETNDADDLEYIKAGWYECIDNWGDYSSVAVCEGVVTHWMELPELPAKASSSTPEGAASK